MKRALLSQLIAWKAKKNRKPLILKGVRQTGKTYLLEQFGRQYFSRYHLINFEKQGNLRVLFEKDLVPSRIIEELCFALKTVIDVKNDLLIFDEIQACPNALTSLKYFCEEMPEIALCAAGSLLGLHLNDGSYPVGKVDMLHLYPLTFHEFLEGIGDKEVTEYLSSIELGTEIKEIAHQQLWERLKHYFITGGLPEAVNTFADTQDDLFVATQNVRQKQEELINAYYADIAKHSGKVNAMHIDRTWRSVPLQLAQTQDSGSKKFKFNEVLPQIKRYAQLVNVIDWLISAELVLPISILETVRQPLMAYTKQNSFKLMMFDVGILGAMNGLDPKLILDYGYGSYKGFFAENFVATQLVASGVPNLFSWHDNRLEIEFLMEQSGMVVPLEVKAGSVSRAQSLQKYIEKYHPQTSIVLSGKNRITDAQASVWHMPLYLAEYTKKFISQSQS